MALMNSSMGADDLGVGVGYPSMVTGDLGTDTSLGFGLKGHGPSLLWTGAQSSRNRACASDWGMGARYQGTSIVVSSMADGAFSIGNRDPSLTSVDPTMGDGAYTRAEYLG